MILNLCGSEEYTPVFCFSIRGGDVRVSAPFCTWSMEFSGMASDVMSHYRVGVLFHFRTREVK